jgi:predicted transcriptional regulator
VIDQNELSKDADFTRTLRIIGGSNHRRSVLLSLLEGKKSFRELYTELDVRPPDVKRCLHQLESGKFVRVDEKRYALTFFGRGVALKIIDLCTMMDVLKEHETFWIQHDTTGIPDHLLGMMLLLRDATVLVSSPADIFEAYRRGIVLFEGAKVFKFVSAAGIPDAERFLNTFASNKVPLQLVITEDLLRALIDRADLVRVAKALGDQCELYVLRRDPKFTLALSDRIMVLMLASRDRPKIDLASALIARNKEGVIWGKVLLDHYVHASERVSL